MFRIHKYFKYGLSFLFFCFAGSCACSPGNYEMIKYSEDKKKISTGFGRFTVRFKDGKFYNYSEKASFILFTSSFSFPDRKYFTRWEDLPPSNILLSPKVFSDVETSYYSTEGNSEFSIVILEGEYYASLSLGRYLMLFGYYSDDTAYQENILLNRIWFAEIPKTLFINYEAKQCRPVQRTQRYMGEHIKSKETHRCPLLKIIKNKETVLVIRPSDLFDTESSGRLSEGPEVYYNEIGEKGSMLQEESSYLFEE